MTDGNGQVSSDDMDGQQQSIMVIAVMHIRAFFSAMHKGLQGNPCMSNSCLVSKWFRYNCPTHASLQTWQKMYNSFGANWELSGLPNPPIDLRITNTLGQKVIIRSAIKVAGATGIIETTAQFPMQSDASPNGTVINVPSKANAAVSSCVGLGENCLALGMLCNLAYQEKAHWPVCCALKEMMNIQ